MAKISLHVNDTKLDILLTILENLKDGLIENIEVDRRRTYNKLKSIDQKNIKSIEIKSKYVDPQTFKERLKKMRKNNAN